MIWITGLSFVFSLLLTILLLVGAGRRNTDNEIHLNFLDRIPYDLLLGGFGLFLIFEIYLLDATTAAMLLPLSGITCMLLVPLLLTTAVRLKAGVFLKNTLCFFCWF